MGASLLVRLHIQSRAGDPRDRRLGDAHRHRLSNGLGHAHRGCGHRLSYRGGKDDRLGGRRLHLGLHLGASPGGILDTRGNPGCLARGNGVDDRACSKRVRRP